MTPVKDRLLTDVELELMTIIWSLGQTTVKDVIAHLPKDRILAYTSVATVMKILQQKGFLQCQKESYAHSFSALISKSSYEKTCVEHMVTHVFDGEPVALVQRLLDAKTLSQQDIQTIERALGKLLAKERGED